MSKCYIFDIEHYLTILQHFVIHSLTKCAIKNRKHLIYIYINVCVCAHACAYVCMHIYVYIFVCMCVCVDIYTWTCWRWPTDKNLLTSVLCGHRMLFGKPAGSDGWQGRMERKSQGKLCCQYDLILMIMLYI